MRVKRRIRRVAVRALMLAAAVVTTVGLPTPVAADDWKPPSTVYIAAAGHTADGLFLDLWRERRDLTGDPITEEFQPRSSFAQGGEDTIVQFYENVAFSYDPDAADGVVVRLLDVGRQHLESLLADSPMAALRTAVEPTTCPPAAGDCVEVPGSDHTVRDAVRAFWERSGGTEWLGDPLTEDFRAADGSYLQFFERGALRVDGDGVAPLPLGRIVAGRQNLEVSPIDQPEGVPTYDEALFVAPPNRSRSRS
ncbi:MAG: hypothetical protein H0U10_15300 [Chloroflexia bacterium]|nr:hypothetical protein [Chloroflexia bacterium]